MYDISGFQKCNFYLICITSKFYLKSFLPPSSFGVKSGCNRIGLKTTFLEPDNIIYHCLVLGFLDSFHDIPTDFSKTTCRRSSHKIRRRRPRAGNYKIITVRDHSVPQKSSNSCYNVTRCEKSEERGPIKRFEQRAGLFRIFEIILQHLSSPPPAILLSP